MLHFKIICYKKEICKILLQLRLKYHSDIIDM